MQERFEFKVYIKDKNLTQSAIKAGAKAFGLFFVFVFIFFCWQFSFAYLAIGQIGETANERISSTIFLTFMLALLGAIVSLLFAIGSYFQKSVAISQSQGHTKVIFAEDNVVFVKGLNVEEKDWSYFQKAKEDIDNFYFYTTDGSNFSIADITFQTKEQIIKFRDLVRSKLGKNAKLRN